ncbi:MAG: alpha/beta fold hydrolase [Lysobacterales bacterium]
MKSQTGPTDGPPSSAWLLPGLDGDGALRSAFITAMAPQMRVHPLSYPSSGPNHYAALQRVLASSLGGADEYILIAESFGGPLACAIATTAPPGLRGLVLVASFLRRPLGRLGPIARLFPIQAAKRVPEWVLRTLLFDAQSAPGAVATTLAAVQSLPLWRLAERRAAALSVDARGWLQAVKVPVLIVQAGADRILSQACRAELANALPSAQTILMDGPHALLQSRPCECAEVITRWCQETVRADGLA